MYRCVLRRSRVQCQPDIHLQGIYGAGAHTDYGLLTVLATDENPGLQICTEGKWAAVRPVPGTFIINLGDMLERCAAASGPCNCSRFLDLLCGSPHLATSCLQFVHCLASHAQEDRSQPKYPLAAAQRPEHHAPHCYSWLLCLPC